MLRNTKAMRPMRPQTVIQTKYPAAFCTGSFSTWPAMVGPHSSTPVSAAPMPIWISTISQKRRWSRHTSRREGSLALDVAPARRVAFQRADSGATKAMATASTMGAAPMAAMPRQPNSG